MHALDGDVSYMVMRRLPDIVNKSLATSASRTISSVDATNVVGFVPPLMNQRAWKSCFEHAPPTRHG
jgi:hypothetical protein